MKIANYKLLLINMIVFFTTVLILLCLVIVLLIMVQRTSGGMGSALGGGTADQVLGAGSAAQLSKFTVYGILGFFVLSFVLYALYQFEAGDSKSSIRAGSSLPALNSESIPSESEGLFQQVETPVQSTIPNQSNSAPASISDESKAETNNSQ